LIQRYTLYVKTKKACHVVTSLLKIFIDKSSYSPATHMVLKMMVVGVYIDRVSHLRVLRNQIVGGSQNFRSTKSQISSEYNKR